MCGPGGHVWCVGLDGQGRWLWAHCHRCRTDVMAFDEWVVLDRDAAVQWVVLWDAA